MTTIVNADYWEALWGGGRRYRHLDGAEARLMDERLGAGRGRRALDIGCGDGSLARHLHHERGYRTTGIDISPTAVELAASHDTRPGSGPAWRCADITNGDLTTLPDPAYAVITCRLVYRWMDDKNAFLSRVRHLLAPGGLFWVVTEIAGRREDTDPLHSLGISPAETELLTSGWSSVQTADLDVLRCFALRP
ncbi:class I SAM-dependent methyltransferase [Streptomyces sp. NPDC001553]|uniref:class I SAM-dependent methyltransferase n=1 Tax=Streptomyces sp. NPDC001553 TaxID=3154385 RepID=UPI003321602A